MADLMTFTLAGFLFWPIAATAIVWTDIQPRTGEQLLATVLAGIVGGWFLAIFAGVVVWYVVRSVKAEAHALSHTLTEEGK